MSVPATKAWPPAPRSTATRTSPARAASDSQCAASDWYMDQVIALRAAGRSNTSVAMPSATER
jgi:hypothetical protein